MFPIMTQELFTAETPSGVNIMFWYSVVIPAPLKQKLLENSASTAWRPARVMTTAATSTPPHRSATWWTRLWPASPLLLRCRAFPSAFSTFAKIFLVMEIPPQFTGATMNFSFATLMDWTTSVWTTVFKELLLKYAAVMETCKFIIKGEDS